MLKYEAIAKKYIMDNMFIIRGENMEQEKSIGIFDSGIGGVTVLKEIIKQLPNENYIYYSDSSNNPYGDKSDKEIIKISDNIVKYLLANSCKTIVIACNTASAKAASFLRKKYKDMTFIAIEPAYKMVYDYAYENETLLLATKATLESEKFNILYKKYDNHKTYLYPCIGLADLIEKEDLDGVKEYLEKNLKPYKNKVKNVVLGCTHYPLIQEQIKETLGDVLFFNGSQRLAVHLKNVLAKKDMLSKKGGAIKFIDSANSKSKEERFYKILRENLN